MEDNDKIDENGKIDWNNLIDQNYKIDEIDLHGWKLVLSACGHVKVLIKLEF